MKIRHPALIRSIGMFGGLAMRGWLSTLGLRYRNLGPNMDPYQHGGLPQNYIYAFWHEYMILLCRYAKRDIHILISHHTDGEIIARICQHLGFSVVRGSTSRGGTEALWKMFRLGEKENLVITPDGPRGPRRTIQPGLTYLASRTGLPIMPIGVAYPHCWRLSSWDRFAVPMPGSVCYGVTADPIHVPAAADRQTLEEYRLRVQNQLLWLGDLAERWGATGRWPGSAYRSADAAAKKAVA